MIHTITIDTMEMAEHSTVPTYSIEKKIHFRYYRDFTIKITYKIE